MIQPFRTIGIAASLVLVSTGIASAQRGGLPRLVTAPAPPATPATPPAAGRGMMGVPRAAGPTGPKGGGLPRLTTRPGRDYSRSRFKHFHGSYLVGYPFWTVPYFYDYYGSTYVESAAASYAPESAGRAAPKLIVIGGGSAGGGDALTVESLGDSVRLSWLVAGRAAREVKLFVADSAHRELATRSASPSTPTAVFEVATLSAPVAFAGVTVTFTDGVVTTTLVPYRQQR